MTPDQYTIAETFLEVGDGHTLYVHDWGNASAKKTILFLHGGPGSGTSNRHKQLFDPERQRVIFFDQRGSGRSTPYGSIEHNTTDDLVADIESIRELLKLDSFIITGGSWGSCLAYSYVLKHPNRVSALVLRGIFTGSKRETDWVDKGLFVAHFPDVWDIYLSETPPEHQSDPSVYHFARAVSDDEIAAKQSSYAYNNLEGALLSLDDRYVAEDFETYDPFKARIEMHYLQNGCFMPDRHILDNASKIEVPVWQVQGRYDMVCPPITAYEMHQSLPQGELIWTTSGHRDEREAWNVQRTLLLNLTEQK